ncbi:MAG: hypothetical protein Q8N22_00700 [bacterium]|nr:hypothetical protein [bacterium]
MKNIKPFIIILLAFVVVMPVISLAQTTNISGTAVSVPPTAIQAVPTETKSAPVSNTVTTQVMPAETKSVSTSNTATTKCGVNSFSVSNECGVGAFKNSYVQCYDGYTENQGGDSSCKPSSLWQEYAKSVCVNHCAITNTTTNTKSSAPSAGSSAGSSSGQNVPITSTKTVSPGIPVTAATPQVISVCYIGNDLMKQYDILLSDLQTTQANGDTEKSDAITQRILELKKQITASKERCNTATTQLQSPTVVQSTLTISPATATAVEVNRCGEVKQWQEKIIYYQELNALSDTELKNKTGLSRDGIKNNLTNLEDGLQKVKAQCSLQTVAGVSSVSNRAIIAEPVKPVAIQSAQEIDTYYKAKIENISAIQNTSQQVKELQTLKYEKTQMVGDLIKNRNEIEASEINQVATDIKVSKNEMKIDNVIIVEATGKRILLNVGDRPISVESNGSIVIIKDKNLEVTTDNVSISDNLLKIGNVEVKMTASQAAEKLNIAPTAVQLTTENDQPVYKMEVSESRNLFGFIKINTGNTQTVSADNGNLISEKRPWYYFLTTK